MDNESNLFLHPGTHCAIAQLNGLVDAHMQERASGSSRSFFMSREHDLCFLSVLQIIYHFLVCIDCSVEE